MLSKEGLILALSLRKKELPELSEGNLNCETSN